MVHSLLKSYISRRVNDYGKLTLPAKNVQNLLTDGKISHFCDVNNFVFDQHGENVTFIKIVKTCVTK